MNTKPGAVTPFDSSDLYSPELSREIDAMTEPPALTSALRPRNTIIQQKLESLVDGIGLAVICDVLAEICHLKAEHLLSAWQDEAASNVWLGRAKHLARVADALRKQESAT